MSDVKKDNILKNDHHRYVMPDALHEKYVAQAITLPQEIQTSVVLPTHSTPWYRRIFPRVVMAVALACFCVLALVPLGVIPLPSSETSDALIATVEFDLLYDELIGYEI